MNNSPSGGSRLSSSSGSKEPEWKILYQAAMLELDTEALPPRIEAAQAAIHSRMAELEGSQAGTESSQLQDALHMLDLLRRIYRTKD
jgi:hypothetical protein